MADSPEGEAPPPDASVEETAVADENDTSDPAPAEETAVEDSAEPEPGQGAASSDVQTGGVIPDPQAAEEIEGQLGSRRQGRIF